MTDTKKPMDLDEILGIISEIARHGDGADRFRAIKVLKDLVQESGSSGLPDPMDDKEAVERMARLMKAMGPMGTQFAYRKAYPNAKVKLENSKPRVLLSYLNIDEGRLPTTLKALNRMFPDIKRGGFPSGYPLNKGLEAQKKWCQNHARNIILNREQEAVNGAVEEDKEVLGASKEEPSETE